MTRDHCPQRGLSLAEAIVVISIVFTLATLAVPNIGSVKRGVYVTTCVGQMNEIAVAIQAYRQDHGGMDPYPLETLFPRYLNKEVLVCPLTRAICGDEIQRRQAARHQSGKPPWSSYFLFARKGLDILNDRDESPIGYSDVLKKRAGDTPLVLCRDHREPFSLFNVMLSVRPDTLPDFLKNVPTWYIPEAPIIVLRHDGRVTTTKKGGCVSDRTWGFTDYDLLEL